MWAFFLGRLLVFQATIVGTPSHSTTASHVPASCRGSEYNGTSWTSVTNMPNNQGSFGAASGTLTAGIVYGGYGNPQSTSAKTVSYDGTNWTDLPSPGSDVNNARDFTRGGGGTQTAAIFSGGNPTTGATETFDGSSWSEQNNMVLARYGAGFIGTQTNGLYAGGAGAPGRTAVTEEWDGSVWTTCPASLSTARNGTIHSKSSGTAAVIAGGYTGSAYPTATEEFNSSINVETTGSWASGGSMNLDRSTGNILGTSTTSALYVGGYRGPTPSPPSFQGQTAVESYNGTSWTNSNALPVAFYSGFSMGTTTAGLRAGGAKSTAQYGPDPNSDESQEYNGTSWTGVPNSPYSSRDPGQGGVQTAAIFFGGQGPSIVSTSISYDGSSFSGIPSMSNIRRSCNGTGSSSATITVGGAGPAGGSPEGVMTNVEHYNGSAWAEESTTPYAVASGGSGGVETACLMVGGVSPGPEGPEAGVFTTLEYDGSSWTAGGNASTARNRSNAGLAGTQTAMLVYGGGPNKQAVESYDGSSFSNDSTLGSGHNGRGNHNTTGYSTSAIYVGAPNPPGSAPGANTVEEYTAAAAATTTVTVS